jgi:hypothetical protein
VHRRGARDRGDGGAGLTSRWPHYYEFFGSNKGRAMVNVIDAMSLFAVPLTIKSNNNIKIATATGFFWNGYDEKLYLVTNYHVISGNHYFNNTSLRTDSAFPAKIEYPRLISSRHPHERVLHTVELCAPDGSNPMWRTHPLHHERPVDVAAVEVPIFETDHSFVHAINDKPWYECDQPLFRYPPGFDLLISGFLLEDRPTGYFPTYIRGFVASEMDALYNGKRAFLIDAHTSSGMSGSPVFATGLEEVRPGEKFSPFKEYPRFIGIYSGRIFEVENGMKRELQVGIVWRRELIRETVASFL